MPARWRRLIVRTLVLFSLAVCLVGWSWSYVRVAGVARIHDDIGIAESVEGSVIVTRTQAFGSSSGGRPFAMLSSKPIWGAFDSSSLEADLATNAIHGYIRHNALGFGFGAARKPDPTSETDGIFDDTTSPPANAPDHEIPEFKAHVSPGQVPMIPVHFHFAVLLPWWFLTLGAASLAVFVWRKTKLGSSPKHAFPITAVLPDQ